MGFDQLANESLQQTGPAGRLSGFNVSSAGPAAELSVRPNQSVSECLLEGKMGVVKFVGNVVGEIINAELRQTVYDQGFSAAFYGRTRYVGYTGELAEVYGQGYEDGIRQRHQGS